MIHLRAAVIPPPMTIRPSISVTAVAMASPATSPNSAKALLGGLRMSPGRVAVGDVADLLGFEPVVGVAGQLAVDALDGADRATPSSTMMSGNFLWRRQKVSTQELSPRLRRLSTTMPMPNPVPKV